jgi:hypothetical protein
MDADHLDIYGDLEHYQQAFRDYAAQVSDFLIIKKGLPITEKDTPAHILTYHISDPTADFHASNIRTDALGHCTFDLVWPEGVVEDVRVGTLGALNVENSVAAAALCLSHGVGPEAIKEANRIEEADETEEIKEEEETEEESSVEAAEKQAEEGKKVPAFLKNMKKVAEVGAGKLGEAFEVASKNTEEFKRNITKDRAAMKRQLLFYGIINLYNNDLEKFLNS